MGSDHEINLSIGQAFGNKSTLGRRRRCREKFEGHVSPTAESCLIGNAESFKVISKREEVLDS